MIKFNHYSVLYLISSLLTIGVSIAVIVSFLIVFLWHIIKPFTT